MSTLEFDQILENVKNRALDLRQSIAHFDLNTTWNTVLEKYSVLVAQLNKLETEKDLHILYNATIHPKDINIKMHQDWLPNLLSVFRHEDTKPQGVLDDNTQQIVDSVQEHISQHNSKCAELLEIFDKINTEINPKQKVPKTTKEIITTDGNPLLAAIINGNEFRVEKTPVVVSPRQPVITPEQKAGESTTPTASVFTPTTLDLQSNKSDEKKRQRDSSDENISPPAKQARNSKSQTSVVSNANISPAQHITTKQKRARQKQIRPQNTAKPQPNIVVQPTKSIQQPARQTGPTQTNVVQKLQSVQQKRETIDLTGTPQTIYTSIPDTRVQQMTSFQRQVPKLSTQRMTFTRQQPLPGQMSLGSPQQANLNALYAFQQRGLMNPSQQKPNPTLPYNNVQMRNNAQYLLLTQQQNQQRNQMSQRNPMQTFGYPAGLGFQMNNVFMMGAQQSPFLNMGQRSFQNPNDKK